MFTARSRLSQYAFVALVICTSVPAVITSCQSNEGSPTAGDARFPGLGNGGYDVDHYDIALKIDPLSNTLDADVTIRATANQRLTRFNLDFGALEIDALEVNQAPAKSSQAENELVVWPAKPLPAGKLFTVHILYSGSPAPVYSDFLQQTVGWYHAEDGSINVMNFPEGASTWLPGNHYPSDKATFVFDITVPKPWVVAAPGNQKELRELDASRQYLFEMDVPMATVSAVFFVDDYAETLLWQRDGLQIKAYIPGDAPGSLDRHFDKLPAILEAIEALYGPYPFKNLAIVLADPGMPLCLNDSQANSEQTINLHCPSLFAVGQPTLVHEIAHQWFGHSTTPSSIADNWLAEGPATYAQWLWEDLQDDTLDLDQIVEGKEAAYHAGPAGPRVTGPIIIPPDGSYTEALYTGGALLLHALRHELGDGTFSDVLQEYLSRYRYSNASTKDFISAAEEVSGRELQSFFDNWLLATDLPLVANDE